MMPRVHCRLSPPFSWPLKIWMSLGDLHYDEPPSGLRFCVFPSLQDPRTRRFGCSHRRWSDIRTDGGTRQFVLVILFPIPRSIPPGDPGTPSARGHRMKCVFD
ncbi:hypothetical protein GALMADRAFT_1048862 [Galerina marginata CBS 339.88]|uniref:Uncharacterized protein n=1 Tax=Galerina marginata (strain CBS 339.88) TaxID=685588 RepID=A0A067SN69_GALM3|nr:hypothetical protein GALMADRAFT_1048862 [Galerina marginata CBS 339.88]